MVSVVNAAQRDGLVGRNRLRIWFWRLSLGGVGNGQACRAVRGENKILYPGLSGPFEKGTRRTRVDADDFVRLFPDIVSEIVDSVSEDILLGMEVVGTEQVLGEMGEQRQWRNGNGSNGVPTIRTSTSA